MPLKATTIKLTPTDEHMIDQIKQRHGISEMIEVFRFAMVILLDHGTSRQHPKKKKKLGRSA